MLSHSIHTHVASLRNGSSCGGSASLWLRTWHSTVEWLKNGRILNSVTFSQITVLNIKFKISRGCPLDILTSGLAHCLNSRPTEVGLWNNKIIRCQPTLHSLHSEGEIHRSCRYLYYEINKTFLVPTSPNGFPKCRRFLARIFFLFSHRYIIVLFELPTFIVRTLSLS